MPPVAAPATSFSARTQAAASRVRPASSAPRVPSWKSSSRARATAVSRAAEEESPAPRGRRRRSPRRTRRRGVPRRAGPRRARPRTRSSRPPGPGRGRPGAGPRLARAEVRDQPDELVVAARQRHERAVGQRERQAEAAVVVEVLADQVHPAGCRPRRRPPPYAARKRSEALRTPSASSQAGNSGAWIPARPAASAGRIPGTELEGLHATAPASGDPPSLLTAPDSRNRLFLTMRNAGFPETLLLEDGLRRVAELLPPT